MSFGYVTFQGEAAEYKPEVQFSAGHERETNVLAEIEKALADVVSCVGGHVSVSAVGHINEYDDQPGDSMNLQVTSFLRPSDPVQDAGASAALSSPRNFPPEASTAAVPASDGSDPAPHQPIPLPAESGATQAAQPEGNTVMVAGVGVTPGAEPNIAPESPAPVEATVEVTIPLDAEGNGSAAVFGDPESIKSETNTGEGQIGEATEGPVEGNPDETQITVTGGEPDGAAVVELDQVEPEDKATAPAPTEEQSSADPTQAVQEPASETPSEPAASPAITSDQTVDEAPQSGAASESQDEPPEAPAAGQQA